jgi:hypothetical protein
MTHSEHPTRGARRQIRGRGTALVTSVLAMAAVVAVSAAPAAAQGGPPEFVTICHVAGSLEDPANLIELTLPFEAVYGQAGHFSEPGTPNAGHEQDIEGPCPTSTTDTEPTPTETEPTPTETEPVSTETEPLTTEEAPPAAGEDGGGELAFTGFPALLVALGGAGLAGLGFGIRRSLRDES